MELGRRSVSLFCRARLPLSAVRLAAAAAVVEFL
jgi:hypothetical protein